MWRPLSKHVDSKVQKRRMKHGNTQNGSKSSLCTEPPLPSGKIGGGVPSPIFPEKRGVCKKANRNPPITDHCFLRGPLRWLTAAKYANVSWPLNLRVRVFLKTAVKAAMFLSKLTGNEPFRLRIYLDTIKFVLPRVFTPKRRLAQEFVQNHGRRSKSAKSPLPVVVRRSKTSIFNVERWNKSVGFRQGYRFSSGQLCTKKSCMYIYRFFSAIFAGPLFVEIQIMLPWQREVTLFLSKTVPRKFNQRLYFSLLSNLV